MAIRRDSGGRPHSKCHECNTWYVQTHVCRYGPKWEDYVKRMRVLCVCDYCTGYEPWRHVQAARFTVMGNGYIAHRPPRPLHTVFAVRRDHNRRGCPIVEAAWVCEGCFSTGSSLTNCTPTIASRRAVRPRTRQVVDDFEITDAIPRAIPRDVYTRRIHNVPVPPGMRRPTLDVPSRNIRASYTLGNMPEPPLTQEEISRWFNANRDTIRRSD